MERSVGAAGLTLPRATQDLTREVIQCGKMPDIDGICRDWLYYGLLRDGWSGREALVERLGLREKARV